MPTQGKSTPLSQQGIDPGTKRVAVVNEATGQIEAATVQSALSAAARGSHRLASQGDIDRQIQQEAVYEADRQEAERSFGGLTADPVKAYALNAWDEMTMGASSQALKVAARLRGGEEGEAGMEAEMQRLRRANPNAYHLGGAAGLIGQFVATEGVAASLRAAKVLEAAEAAEAARVAAAAGDAAKAEYLAKKAQDAERLARFANELEASERAAKSRAAAPAAEAGAEAVTGARWPLTATEERIGDIRSIGAASAERQAAADAIRTSYGRMAEIGDIRSAMRQTETDRLLAKVAEGERETAELGAKIDGALSNVGKASIDAELRMAEGIGASTLPTESLLRSNGILAGAGREAVIGAMQGAHKSITDDAFGDAKFSLEEAMPSIMAGAILGGGAHVGAGLVAGRLAKSASAFSAKESERQVVRKLAGFGVTDKELSKLVTMHGTPGGVYRAMKEAGVDLLEQDGAVLVKNIAEAKEQVLNMRRATLDAAAAVGAVPNVRGVAESLGEIAADPTKVSSLDESFLLNRFAKKISREAEQYEKLAPKEQLERLEKLQSQYNRNLDKLLKSDRPDAARVGALEKTRNLLRAELKGALERSGDPSLASAWDAANRSYATLSKFNRMADKSYGASIKASHGVRTETGTFARVASRAAASTLVFGQPYSLLFGGAEGAGMKVLGDAVNSIRSRAAGIAGKMTATEAARTSFSRAIQAVSTRTATGAPRFRSIDKSMEKYMDRSEFDDMVERITKGAIDQDMKDRLGEADPALAEEANAMEAKLAKNVNDMLPKESPYPIGYAKQKKGSLPSLIDPDRMKVLRYLDAVQDPFSVAEKVVAGVAGPEHIKAVKDMYPTLYANMRAGLEQDLVMGKLYPQGDLSPEVRSALSSFLGMPVSASNGPELAMALATVREQEAKAAEESKKSGGGGGSGPPAGSGANYMTESERIEK